MGFGINTSVLVSPCNICTDGFVFPVYIGTYGATPSLATNTSANIAIGCDAGRAQNTARNNIMIGYIAGWANTSSRDSVLIGASTNYNGKSGYCNVIIGHCAGFNVETGFGNTLIGWSAGNKIVSGCGNTALGSCAIFNVLSNTTWGFTAIGACAGYNADTVTSGNGAVWIGAFISGPATGSNTTWIKPPGSCGIWTNTTGVGLGNTAPAAVLHVTGAMYATSEITAYYSDRRLKENIKPIERALEKINMINGVTYTPNSKAISYGFEEEKRYVGVIADEVEAVVPEVVVPAPFDLATDRDSVTGEYYKTVKYERLVPILVEGIKELKLKLENVQYRIASLKKNNQN